MKKTILVLATMVSLFSCKKSDNVNPDLTQTQGSFQGTWRYFNTTDSVVTDFNDYKVIVDSNATFPYFLSQWPHLISFGDTSTHYTFAFPLVDITKTKDTIFAKGQMIIAFPGGNDTSSLNAKYYYVGNTPSSILVRTEIRTGIIYTFNGTKQ